MRIHLGIQSLFLGLVVAACSACGVESPSEGVEKAKEAGRRYLIDPARAQYEKTIKPSIEQPVEDIAAVKKATAETREAVAEVREGVKVAERTYTRTKKKAERTVDSVRRTARSYARSMPRSRREANQMVEQRGRSIMDWFEKEMEEFRTKHRTGLIQKRNKANGAK